MNARKAENQVLFKSFEAQEWKSAFTHFYMRLAFILLLLDKCFNRWPLRPGMRCAEACPHCPISQLLKAFTEIARCFAIDCG